MAFVFSACCPALLWGQAAAYKPTPKAKRLEDSAINIYTKSHGAPENNEKVRKLLDAALQQDPKYYEGWANKLSFQCRLDQFDNGLITAKKMTLLFPEQADAFFNYGVLQYITGHEKDANISFGQVLTIYNNILEKNKNNPSAYKSILTQKGIILLLLDRTNEGKRILGKLYREEKDEYVKSYIAYYFNSTKDDIIKDRVPGK